MLYFNEFYILVYRLPEDDGVLLEHVGVNKKQYCYVSQMRI
jgi:hypothetical protein